MFKIDEIVIINFRQFQGWPAKVVDIFYIRNQAGYFDVILFHNHRVRIVLPFKSICKVDMLSLPSLPHFKLKAQNRLAFNQAWSSAVSQLKQIRQNQINYHIFHTQYLYRLNLPPSKKQQSPSQPCERQKLKKGFVFCNHISEIINIESVQHKAKNLIEKAFEIKFKQASSLDLLTGVLNFKAAFLCALNTSQPSKLRKVIENIIDAIRILLLIEKQKTQTILMLQSLVEKWEDKSNQIVQSS